MARWSLLSFARLPRRPEERLRYHFRSVGISNTHPRLPTLWLWSCDAEMFPTSLFRTEHKVQTSELDMNAAVTTLLSKIWSVTIDSCARVPKVRARHLDCL